MEDWAEESGRAPTTVEVREIVGRILSIIEKSPDWCPGWTKYTGMGPGPYKADETWKGWGRK